MEKSFLTLLFLLIFILTGCTNKYIEFGVAKNETEALKWEEANVSPWTAKDLTQLGLTLDDAKKWTLDGFKPHWIDGWIKLGIYSPSEAKKWSLSIGSPASEWIDAGMKAPSSKKESVKICKEWSFVIYGKEKQCLSKYERKEIYGEIYKWKLAGIDSTKEVKKWKDANIHSANKVKQWREIDIKNPSIAEKWNKFNFHDINSVLELRKLGINTPEEYKPYSRLQRFGDIKVLKDLRIQPSPLIEDLSKYYNFSKQKKKLKKIIFTLKRHKCKEILNNISNADEYLNKDKCYYFEGTLFQRLSQNNGLMTPFYSNATIHVKFYKEPWRNDTFKIGFAIGIGSYEYETYNDEFKIVPNVKVLFFK